ncbi:MAG: hypothetical protein CL983_05300 [Euryarchaeota archaeon]|nr:hypothetical protein [Euryarchaeota archaeon]
MTFPAIILAGGKSQRMGEEKSLIEIDGKKMILHIFETLKIAGCNDILIQTKQNKRDLKSSLSDLDVMWNYDDSEEGDILSAILSALKFAKSKNWYAVQLLPVDTPFISQKLIKELSNLLVGNLDVILPSSNSKVNTKLNSLEPLMACLKVDSSIKVIQDKVNNENNSLSKIFSEMNCLIVDEKIWSKWGVSEKSFKNINYPRDRE